MVEPLRYPQYMRQRYRAILAYTGLIGVMIGGLILSPLLALPFYTSEAELAGGFLLAGVLLGVPSYMVWRRLKPRSPISLTVQEGAVIVVLSWALAILVGSIPLAIVERLNFTQAVFESTSGWSTAGLSVIDVTQASHMVLLYRSVTQLAGGAGLAIITLSALTGPVGPGLSTAEGREEQLLPHVARSAKLVLVLYGSYVALGIVALKIAGMDWFDSVNHAFTALSTGGFSTRLESIAYWDSVAVEGVVIVLMLLGTLNFLTAYALLRGKFRSVWRNSELRQTAILLVLFATILFFGVTRAVYPSLSRGARAAVFNAVAALSTTGFATVDFRAWNGLGWLVIILAMLMGGGAGSTAGAIKQARVHVLFKGLYWEFKRRFLPNSAITHPSMWQGEQRRFISDEHIRSVSMFVFAYIIMFLVGGGVIAAHGYSLQEGLFESASAVGTIGISVGVTAPDAPAGILWVETMAMLLGRLEFFTVIIGLARLFSDLPTLVSSRRRQT